MLPFSYQFPISLSRIQRLATFINGRKILCYTQLYMHNTNQYKDLVAQQEFSGSEARSLSAPR
ncbi:hypothetical protein TUM4444_37640 [Shewanella sp. MBTL60-112-B1]|nr:hypothetical protein TUM4444_37640 [Shewanella sp. MBTL60-112-B1]